MSDIKKQRQAISHTGKRQMETGDKCLKRNDFRRRIPTMWLRQTVRRELMLTETGPRKVWWRSNFHVSQHSPQKFIAEIDAFLKILGAVPRFGGSQKNPFEFLDPHYTGIM